MLRQICRTWTFHQEVVQLELKLISLVETGVSLAVTILKQVHNDLALKQGHHFCKGFMNDKCA